MAHTWPIRSTASRTACSFRGCLGDRLRGRRGAVGEIADLFRGDGEGAYRASRARRLIAAFSARRFV
jgi:hypothetical protein